MANEDLSKLKIDKDKAAFRPRKKKKFFYPVLILVGLFLVLLAIQGILRPTLKVRAVTVTQIYPSQTFTILNASGYVVPQRKSALASKVTGRLIWLGVEEGNRVKKDQVVARLESQDVTAAKDQASAHVKAARSSLEQAKAELREATLTYNRNKELLAKGVIAQATYDTVLARYEKAVAAAEAAEATVKASIAALDGANIALGYTLIRAPFAGVVLTKNADLGDIVTPIGAAANAKSAVITIADMDSLQVEVDVSEANIQKITSNQPCEIQLDALPEQRFRGVIHMIVPTADRSKATITVKVRFLDKDSRILPEMSAKVAFLSRPATPEEQRPRTAVSQSAIVNRKGKENVFLIQGNRATETPVRLGAKLGDMVEVLQGVKAGDKVVLNPSERLKNGSKIKIEEQ
ncbi:MAG: efflux RND transporter periplasmic adaptor subunit [Desulfobacterales bacterium]|nr:efflux RND transporter periplasmic adaptor subunit [Desulfobacterales bacterium]